MKNYPESFWHNLAEECRVTSFTEISKKYNLDRRTIKRYLKIYNIPIKIKKSELLNHSIFNRVDTEEKAYWLGFLYADGYVSYNTNVISVDLALKDIGHLYNLAKFLNLPMEYVRIKYGKFPSAVLKWNSLEMKTALIELGCKPRKSLVLTFPDSNIFKSPNLIIHFLRGYFDGDGCISFQRHKTCVSPFIRVIGTKEFLEGFIKVSQVPAKFLSNSRYTGNTWEIEYSKDNSVQLLNLMYNNSKIYLKRKFDRAKIFKNGSCSIEAWNNLNNG